MKICLAASAGGHFSQLLKLSECWNEHETICITTTEVVREKLREFGRVCIVGECNREHPIKVVRVLIRCIHVILNNKPHIVISTGAAVGCIACLLGKLFGAKVVWIDSITNIERVSLSGRIVLNITDLFLVQWPELAERYRKVEFVGAVI